MSDDRFLSRWARRKADAKAGRAAPAEPAEPVATRDTPAPVDGSAVAAPLATTVSAVPGAVTPPTELPTEAAGPPMPPAPTLEDVAALAPGDEISRFVARGVDESIKRAAVKKLFADPRYNIMDGLDTYIDDYGQPDPIPMAMLRKMNQSKFLGLFAEEEAAEAAAAAQSAAPVAGPSTAEAATDTAPPPVPTRDAEPAPVIAAVPQATDEDPDLQLQPDDAARRPGAELGAGRGRG